MLQCGMPNPSILLVDDDVSFHLLVNKLLKRWKPSGEYRFSGAQDVPSTRKELRDTEFQVIFLDLSLRGRADAGFHVLEEIRTRGIRAEVVVMSSTSSFESVQRAMRLGANDYLTKGFSQAEFLHSLDKALERSRWRGMEKRLLSASEKELERYCLIGESPRMLSLRESLKKLAPSSVPILVEADTGTGKELVARNLHLQGNDPTSPFVSVDCGAIPSGMAESFFFGHEKGAFTGADSTRIGVFEEASGGTLFLDEISSLSLDLQSKLLRALQEKEIRRVGGRRMIPVDFRLVSAANKHLEKLVEGGLFKQDLFFRLNVIQISLPPLRDRMEDLPQLVKHFVPEYSLEPKLLSLFSSYSWPGNIRELKNLLQACAVMAGEERELSCEHLPEAALSRIHRSWNSDRDNEMNEQSEDWRMRYEQAIAKAEKDTLSSAYHLAQGNVSELSRLLRFDRSHLHKKLARYGIHEPQARNPGKAN